jgi:general secretion pathway protein J
MKSQLTRAFTLIEIMIAMVLLALMGVLMMTSISSSIRAKDTVEDISQRILEIRQAMSRMAREISMAYLSKNFNPLEPTYMTQFKGYENKLYFSAFGHLVQQKDAKESEQQVIGFFIGQDKKGKPALMRKVEANLSLDVEKGGKVQVLCPNVKKIEFSYYDPDIKKWQSTWTSDPSTIVQQEKKTGDGEASATESGPKPIQLPAIVKISLIAEMENGEDMTWTTESAIFVQDAMDLN